MLYILLYLLFVEKAIIHPVYSTYSLPLAVLSAILVVFGFGLKKNAFFAPLQRMTRGKQFQRIVKVETSLRHLCLLNLPTNLTGLDIL